MKKRKRKIFGKDKKRLKSKTHPDNAVDNCGAITQADFLKIPYSRSIDTLVYFLGVFLILADGYLLLIIIAIGISL